MKYQTNPELGPFINHWGCHICSILEKVEKCGGVKFENSDVVTIYKLAIYNGIIQNEIFDDHNLPEDGCTVLDGAGLFNLAAIKKGAICRANSYRKADKNYMPILGEEEILELKRSGYNGSHFVSGTGIVTSPWQGEIEFDPIEGGSNCARSGWIESKRILVIA